MCGTSWPLKHRKKGCQRRQGEGHPKYMASRRPGRMGIKEVRNQEVRQYQRVGGAGRKRVHQRCQKEVSLSGNVRASEKGGASEMPGKRSSGNIKASERPVKNEGSRDAGKTDDVQEYIPRDLQHKVMIRSTHWASVWIRTCGCSVDPGWSGRQPTCLAIVNNGSCNGDRTHAPATQRRGSRKTKESTNGT